MSYKSLVIYIYICDDDVMSNVKKNSIQYHSVRVPFRSTTVSIDIGVSMLA